MPEAARVVVEELIESKKRDLTATSSNLAQVRQRADAYQSEIFKLQDEIAELRSWLDGEALPASEGGYPYG